MPKSSIKDLFDLSGKVAIVTGGSAGIGQGIAARLAEAGAGVMIVGRDHEAASAAALEINQSGGRASSCAADISKVEASTHIVASTIETFGTVDILVNNAAMYALHSTLELTEDDWDKVMNTNLKGAFFLSQAVAKEMIKQGCGGKIINVSSLGSERFQSGMQLYGISKGGLDSLTRYLAGELARYKIYVNAIHPGAHITPGLQRLADSIEGGRYEEQILSRIPLGRFAEPDDTGKVVLFLASSASDYMTGGILNVEGGWKIMA